ncbi:hypothetical protein C3L33_19252, partial [Rhododendron williamsianum]
MLRNTDIGIGHGHATHHFLPKLEHGQLIDLILVFDRAVGTGEPLFNMNSGRLQASFDRVEAIFTHKPHIDLPKDQWSCRDYLAAIDGVLA